MSRVLLDTDVLIDHLRGHRPLRLSDPRLTISIVTRCELFAGRNVEEPTLRKALSPLKELPVDQPIAEAAGRIRRTTGVAVPDALIAATALQHDLPIMTRNHRHFDRVPGLVVQTPPENNSP